MKLTKRLLPEFTFAVRGRNIEPELPSKPLGARNLTDATMLIPFTIDSHLATLQGAESMAGVSIMVFRGVCEDAKVNQVAVNE